MDAYQQYIHKSRYARYLPEEKRRETWEETVNRYIKYWVDRANLNDFEVSEIFKATAPKETYVMRHGTRTR